MFPPLLFLCYACAWNTERERERTRLALSLSLRVYKREGGNTYRQSGTAASAARTEAEAVCVCVGGSQCSAVERERRRDSLSIQKEEGGRRGFYGNNTQRTSADNSGIGAPPKGERKRKTAFRGSSNNAGIPLRGSLPFGKRPRSLWRLLQQRHLSLVGPRQHRLHIREKILIRWSSRPDLAHTHTSSVGYLSSLCASLSSRSPIPLMLAGSAGRH